MVWYPAARGGQPVSYLQYLETMASEDEFTRNAADIKKMTDSRIDGNAGTRREALLRDIARPMQAVRDARAENGKFPVVIYAPSYSALPSKMPTCANTSPARAISSSPAPRWARTRAR